MPYLMIKVLMITTGLDLNNSALSNIKHKYGMMQYYIIQDLVTAESQVFKDIYS